MKLINKLTLQRAQSKENRPTVRTGVGTSQNDSQALPIFTNPKTLSFTAITGIVSFSWSALRNLPQEFWESQYVPLILSLVLSSLLGTINLSELHKNTPLSSIEYILGFLMAALNGLIIFGAVLGAASFTS